MTPKQTMYVRLMVTTWLNLSGQNTAMTRCIDIAHVVKVDPFTPEE